MQINVKILELLGRYLIYFVYFLFHITSATMKVNCLLRICAINCYIIDKGEEENLTIPIKIVPVGSITPRPSSNSKSGHLQIGTTQLDLLFLCFKRSRALRSNCFYSVNSRVTKNSKTRIANMKRHEQENQFKCDKKGIRIRKLKTQINLKSKFREQFGHDSNAGPWEMCQKYGIFPENWEENKYKLKVCGEVRRMKRQEIGDADGGYSVHVRCNVVDTGQRFATSRVDNIFFNIFNFMLYKPMFWKSDRSLNR